MALLRPGIGVAYILIFSVVSIGSGLVSGDMTDSGLGISLVRLLQVPSKVRDGLMRADEGGLFSGLGLIMGDFLAMNCGDFCVASFE